VHGFATSFEERDVTAVLGWHRALRSTVVQVYDWMASYTEPLGPKSGWKDPSNRPVSFKALHDLAAGLRHSAPSPMRTRPSTPSVTPSLMRTPNAHVQGGRGGHSLP